jgi:D-psicose/D-tagatose/L-ribulose 3-epimerase
VHTKGEGMQFGVNLLLYGDTVGEAVTRRFTELRRAGAQGVEVPVFKPGAVDTQAIRKAVEAAGFACTVSGALPPGCCWYGAKSGPRRDAEGYVRGCIKAAAELGATVICGPLYKSVGDMDESQTLERQRRETARAMRDVAQEAAEKGVVLALEPLNRFETNLLNTVEQGIEFCQRAVSPGLGLLLDTFHMHIEEKDSPTAIAAAARAGVLAHFHASENDRGVAGSGQVHWLEIATALRTARYDGWVVIESFSQRGEAIRRAVSCWRPFYRSEAEFVRSGLAFARRTFAG